MRALLALFAVALVIGIAVTVLRNSSQGPAPVRPVDTLLPRNIDVALKKARFSEIQDGQVAWELVAEEVNYNKGGDIAYLSDIRMEFKQSRSHGMVTVTADKGEYSSTAKIVRLNGRVHVVTEDGASFTTNSILYTGATAQFSTADPVTFQQQRLHLTAIGMNLGVNTQQARFFSVIDASIASR